jgi:phosphatidylserine/phosphatidylglycerophosphate/cardiolipin synthase-like enzyme
VRTTLLAPAALLVLGTAAQAQTQPVQAAVSVCFVPSSTESCTQDIVTAIDNAKSQIRVISYEMTSRPIIDALANAHGRGVDVQVIADKRNLSGPEQLANLGVDVRFDDKVTIAHN